MKYFNIKFSENFITLLFILSLLLILWLFSKIFKNSSKEGLTENSLSSKYTIIGNAVAVDNYTAEVSDEINLIKDENLKLVEQTDDKLYWYVINGNETLEGYVPAEFIKIIKPTTTTTNVEPTTTTASTTIPTTTISSFFMASPSPSLYDTGSPSTSPAPMPTPSSLIFDETWTPSSSPSNNVITYPEVINTASPGDSTDSNNDFPIVVPKNVNIVSIPNKDLIASPGPVKYIETNEKAIANDNYMAKDQTQLNLRLNEVVTIIAKYDDWCYIVNYFNMKGFVPTDYLDVIKTNTANDIKETTTTSTTTTSTTTTIKPKSGLSAKLAAEAELESKVDTSNIITKPESILSQPNITTTTTTTTQKPLSYSDTNYLTEPTMISTKYDNIISTPPPPPPTTKQPSDTDTKKKLNFNISKDPAIIIKGKRDKQKPEIALFDNELFNLDLPEKVVPNGMTFSNNLNESSGIDYDDEDNNDKNYIIDNSNINNLKENNSKKKLDNVKYTNNDLTMTNSINIPKKYSDIKKFLPDTDTKNNLESNNTIIKNISIMQDNINSSNNFNLNNTTTTPQIIQSV